MKRTRKDAIASMAKDKLVEAYRSMESRLTFYDRLEQLRANYCSPFAIETIDLGDYDKDAPGETLTGEVYAPLSASGGILRMIWRSANGRDSYVIVKGFEDWTSDCLRRDTSRFTNIGERILAERLNIQVNQKRPRPAA